MCTCNGERFIREQLDSIMAQTCPAEEIIIQDDASDDRTLTLSKNMPGVIRRYVLCVIPGERG